MLRGTRRRVEGLEEVHSPKAPPTCHPLQIQGRGLIFETHNTSQESSIPKAKPYLVLTLNCAETYLNALERTIIKTINSKESYADRSDRLCRTSCETYHLELGRVPIGAQGTWDALRSLRPLRTPSNTAGTQEEQQLGFGKARV